MSKPHEGGRIPLHALGEQHNNVIKHEIHEKRGCLAVYVSQWHPLLQRLCVNTLTPQVENAPMEQICPP